MNARTLFLLVSMLLVASSVSVFGDGMILPDHPEYGGISVVYHDVEIHAEDGVVTTHVDQLFRNTGHREMEGRYVFPLPHGAIVSSFTMWIDGQALEARLLDADEARQLYEDYVRRAIDPALLEYVGRDTLSARIFPIPAGSQRRIEITYTELLTPENGLYRYRYPLDTERFSLDPLERVSIEATVETTSSLTTVYSPSHKLTVTRSDPHTATGTYQEHDTVPTQDFLLYFAVSDDEMGMTALTYRTPDEDGVFLLIVNPPQVDPSTTAIPKDLVFVLDQSGSMSGEKIEQAKEALQFILQNLNPDDRFAVISFSDYTQSLHRALSPVTARSIDDAVDWVGQLEANGGTNIDQALNLSFSLFESNDRPRFLIFLTDGEPTVGEENPATIAAHARAANSAEARVFVFGVGYNVNTVLLDQLAQENRGTTTYVLPGENLEVTISGFYRKIASPLLADLVLTVEGEGIQVLDVFPRQLPDLFRGTQLLVLGRYRGQGDARVTIAGQAEGTRTAYTTWQSFPATSLDASFLPRLWAGRKVAYLLDQIRLYGESSELVDEVISLSRRYGIITPYTSFLVDDVDLAGEEAADAVYRAAAPAVGASAVQGSSALKTLAQGETVQPETEGVRIVENRIYFLRDGYWTDADYADEETIDIALYSPAYFALPDLVPWIGPHLAVAEKVIIRVGNQYIRIGDDGLDELDPATQELLTP